MEATSADSIFLNTISNQNSDESTGNKKTPNKFRYSLKSTPTKSTKLMEENYFYVNDSEIEDTTSFEVYLSTKEKADLELSIKLRDEGNINTLRKSFELSDREEFESLIKNGVIKLEKFDQTKHGNVRLFNSRLVCEIKGKGTDNPYEKTRMVVAAWGDKGKSEILTQSPTLQRASQRLIAAISPSLLKLKQDGFSNMGIWLRDISQAYTQSTSMLNLLFCANLPQKFKESYPPSTIMVVLKPLYGNPEAGTHWWATYMEHHVKELGMKPSTYDPCLLISTEDMFGLVGMQTDDTLILGEIRFSEKEEKRLKFNAKPKKQLFLDTPLQFNGSIFILNEDYSVDLRQNGQGKKIELIDASLGHNSTIKHDLAANSTIKKAYIQQRARGAYLASICQPEACYELSVAAQIQNPYQRPYHQTKWKIELAKESPRARIEKCISRPISRETLCFCGASFANNADLSSQIGFVIVLANEIKQENHKFSINGNIVHYSSTKANK
ncbi:hypothetical protein K3495_g5393 [Podosphaera aphanis]|nr:hypothetical protein K3495_g5393 [Podosphaera aphanis]